MNDAKRKNRQQKAAWLETKTAVHKYAKNPCEATEQEVSTALHKVRDLHERGPEPKSGKRKSK